MPARHPLSKPALESCASQFFVFHVACHTDCRANKDILRLKKVQLGGQPDGPLVECVYLTKAGAAFARSLPPEPAAPTPPAPAPAPAPVAEPGKHAAAAPAPTTAPAPAAGQQSGAAPVLAPALEPIVHAPGLHNLHQAAAAPAAADQASAAQDNTGASGPGVQPATEQHVIRQQPHGPQGAAPPAGDGQTFHLEPGVGLGINQFTVVGAAGQVVGAPLEVVGAAGQAVGAVGVPWRLVGDAGQSPVAAGGHQASLDPPHASFRVPAHLCVDVHAATGHVYEWGRTTSAANLPQQGQAQAQGQAQPVQGEGAGAGQASAGEPAAAFPGFAPHVHEQYAGGVPQPDPYLPPPWHQPPPAVPVAQPPMPQYVLLWPAHPLPPAHEPPPPALSGTFQPPPFQPQQFQPQPFQPPLPTKPDTCISGQDVPPPPPPPPPLPAPAVAQSPPPPPPPPPPEPWGTAASTTPMAGPGMGAGNGVGAGAVGATAAPGGAWSTGAAGAAGQAGVSFGAGPGCGLGVDKGDECDMEVDESAEGMILGDGSGYAVMES